MSRLIPCWLAALMACALMTDRASALVHKESVTPASVQEKDSKFSVTAEKRKDGLIHFAVTYRLPRPQYLVAHFELRDGETSLVKTDTPSFVRESAATFHVALSPKHLANSTFEVSESSFNEPDGQPPVALPGGTIFQIDLEAFGKDVGGAKPD